MNTDTGHIYFESATETDEKKALRAKLRKQGKLEPISDGDIERVVNMNRRQRRAWAAQQRAARARG